jgi:hypothetical protein
MDEEHKKLLKEQNELLEGIYGRLGWALLWLFLIVLCCG